MLFFFAFYVFALDTSPGVTAVAAIMAIALTFVPMLWVHPWRVIKLRRYAVAASLIFALSSARVIASGFPASAAQAAILVSIALLAAGFSVYRQSHLN